MAPTRPIHGSLTRDLLGKTFVGQEADSATDMSSDDVFSAAVVASPRRRASLLAGALLLIAGVVAAVL